MGLLSLSDAITNRILLDTDEVIALVIKQKKGGFPDAETTITKPAIHAQDRYEAVSLPLRGKSGDYGDFAPHEGQTSLKLLLSSFNKENWDDFADEAFDYTNGEEGIDLPKTSIFPNENPEKTYLGLFVIAASTYENLLENSSRRVKEQEIDDIMEILIDARKSMDAKIDEKFNASIFNGYHKDVYETLDGRKINVPTLFNIQTQIDGYNTLSKIIKHSINNLGVNPYKHDLSQKENYDEFKEKVRALADFENLMYALRRYDLTLDPSNNVGQSDNTLRIANLTALNLISTIDSMANNEKYGPEWKDEIPEGVEKLREKLQAAIDAIDAYKENFEAELKSFDCNM